MKNIFNDDEVVNLNKFQSSGLIHPFTCCGPNIVECERNTGISEGVLIASNNGWVCPCGKYTQNWAHKIISTKPNTYLFLDDIREPVEVYEYTKMGTYIHNDWKVVRNFEQFIDWITKNGLPYCISFDHDLADTHYTPEIYWTDYEASKKYQEAQTHKEKTGYECAMWLVDYCMDNNIKLPKYHCHSMNPVGRDKILGLFESFKKSG